jgi:hypothetical protein
MKRRFVGAAAASCIALGTFATTAGADPGNSQGHGAFPCVVPGTAFSQIAQFPGSNGGPNAGAAFNNAPGVPAGSPNAPGQVVKYQCTPNTTLA